MNAKLVIPGVCLAGAAVLVIDGMKKSEAHVAYLNEVEKLNRTPLTNHGQRDEITANMAKIREAIDPQQTKLCLDEQKLASKAKTLEEKIIHYRRALEIDPDNENVIETLADQLLALGEKDEARLLYKKIADNSKIAVKVSIAKGMMRLIDQKK